MSDNQESAAFRSVLCGNAPWEEKGRGVALFACSEQPSADLRMERTAHIRPQKVELDPCVVDRVVVSGFDESHLSDDVTVRGLLDRVVLPCYRRRIPLYFFTSAPRSLLNGGRLPFGEHGALEESLARLRREQLGHLLAISCVCFTDPASLADATTPPQTPIEAKLAKALLEEGLPFTPQAPLGPFVVDFLLEASGRLLAVEVDGREFHEPERDRRRDHRLVGEFGVSSVLRFSGSEVFHDPQLCAARVRERLVEVAALGGGEAAKERPAAWPTMSAEQAACLQPTEGAVLTLAPAGSGKTRVLTRRVVEAARNGTKPERVLCLVFNKGAEQVMKGRIHGEAKIRDVAVRTLHSLGLEIVARSPYSPYRGFEVLDDESEQRKIVREAVAEALGDFASNKWRGFIPDEVVTAYMEHVGVYKSTLAEVGASDLDGAVEGFSLEAARRVRQAVDESMRLKRVITFDDMIYRAVEVLLTEPRTRAQYQHRFDTVLVDEVQDLTPVQFLMVRILALPLNNLFAVGDDDQMIYSFTGADPRNLREFDEWFRGAKIHTLGENFRCSAPIVTKSANLISHNLSRFPKNIRPAEQDPTPEGLVRTYLASTPDDEAKEAAAQIKRWHEQGVKYRDIAVLVRVKNVASFVQVALRAADIPHVPLAGARFYTSRAVALVHAHLRVCVNPNGAKEKDLDAALCEPNRYLKKEVRKALARGGWPAIGRMEGVPDHTRDNVERYVAAVWGVNAEVPRRPAAEVLDFMVGQLGLEEHLKGADKNGTNREVLAGTDALGVLRGLAKDHESLEGFVRWLDAQADEERKQTGRKRIEERGDEVLIETVHRVKGAEFQCVVVFHADENVMPHRHAIESKLTSAMEEERRVCYVAVTRAVNDLLVTATSSERSRFLAQMESPREVAAAPLPKAEPAVAAPPVDRSRGAVEQPKSLLGSIFDFLARLFGG